MSNYKLVEIRKWNLTLTENLDDLGEAKGQYYDYSEDGTCFHSKNDCPRCGCEDSFMLSGGVKNQSFRSNDFCCLACNFSGEVEALFGEAESPLENWHVIGLPECVVVDCEAGTTHINNIMLEEYDEYNGIVHIDRDSKTLVLSTKTDDDDTSWDYDIPFSWLKTNHDVAHWMRHLAEKNWMTTDKFESLGAAIMRLSDEGFI